MGKYRKLPVVIEAIKCRDLLNQAECSFKDLPKNIVNEYNKGKIVFADQSIHINTLEGIMIAGKDDYIIEGVNGEFYPCRPDIFEKTYEKV